MEHEDNRPLVAFTTLEPLAAGGLAGLLLVRGPGLVGGTDWGALLLLAFALVALAASFLHLGHPFRAYRAIARLSTSWLSREVLLFGMFVVCLTAYSVPWTGGDYPHQIYGTLGVALGFLAVVATGKVYQLSACPAWNHWATVAAFPLGFLSAGVAFGAFASTLATSPGPRGHEGMSIAIIVTIISLAIALIVSWVRLRRLRDGNEEERAAWQLLVNQYRWALMLRIIATAMAAIMIATTGVPFAFAWIVAALGEMGDRVLLFYVAVPITPRDRAGASRFAPVPPPAAVRPPIAGRA